MYVIVYINAIWLILTKLKKETFNHRLLIKKLHLLVFELDLALYASYTGHLHIDQYMILLSFLYKFLYPFHLYVSHFNTNSVQKVIPYVFCMNHDNFTHQQLENTQFYFF